jgi:hypothetical protein
MSRKSTKIRLPSRYRVDRLYALPCLGLVDHANGDTAGPPGFWRGMIHSDPKQLVCSPGCFCFFKTKRERRPVRLKLPLRIPTAGPGDL